jgi:hypothetical protein
MLKKDIFKIKYKKITEENWKTLSLKESHFERSDIYCDEWYSEEIMEHLYAIEDKYSIDDVHKLFEFQGNYWNDVVMPIYNHFNK